MKKPAMLFMILLVLLGLGSLRTVSAQSAEEWVRRGIDHFRGQEYDEAGKAFVEADVIQPEDLRIAYDRACVHAARQEAAEAIELFQKASLSREQDLAVKARYNLGALAAAQAQGVFGEEPEAAQPEQRQEGLDLLHRAVRHYRDVLNLEPDHEDARHNIELIRLWIKQMEAIWKERDRQQQRDEVDLLGFLEWLESRQIMLRSLTRALSEEPDSPRRRQALNDTEREQRALVEEIEPLKKKIDETLGGPTAQQGMPGGPAQGMAQGGQPAMDPEKLAQALERLKGWAEESGAQMIRAADLIPDSPEDAPESQTLAVDSLNNIFNAVAPFSKVLDKALKSQQALVEVTSPLVETPDEAERVRFDDMAWQEGRVAGWSDVMTYKAREELKNLESMPQDAGTMQAQPGVDPEKMKEQQEALKKAMEKAVELSPKIYELADSAAGLLQEENPVEALPKEEEALKLLKEIAEEMPKQDQDQQGQDQQDQQDQQEQQEENKDQEQNQQDQQEQQQQQQELSRQEAENLLQKAKEQENEYREKAVQPVQPGGVEKDW